MVTGLTEDAWTIAKPLLFFVLAPTAIGMAIQRNSASLAAGLQPYVKKMTGISTINRRRSRFSAFANRAGLTRECR